MSSPGGPDAADAPHCYRHPHRETWIRCQRCERPICPDCMNEASVGYQCPECVRAGRRSVRGHVGRYGGRPVSNPHTTTIGLIGLNVAVWLAITAAGGTGSKLFHWLSLLPAGRCYTPDLDRYSLVIHHAGQCQQQGGVWFPGVADGAWWQLITSVFTHAEILHIGFNMLALWFLGPPLEMVLGRARYLAVYLVSGLAGSAAVMTWAGAYSLTEGASGAIFGVMGALIVVGLRLRAPMQQLWLWLGLNIVFTFTVANISWEGHLGGLVGGALVAAGLVLPGRRFRLPVQATTTAVVAVVAVLICVARAAALG